MYCGTEYQVKRGEGIVSLAPIADEIRKVSVGTDKTASELAIIRSKEDLAKLNKELIEEQNRFTMWERNLSSYPDLSFGG
jgi:hypothetical protein